MRPEGIAAEHDDGLVDRGTMLQWFEELDKKRKEESNLQNLLADEPLIKRTGEFFHSNGIEADFDDSLDSTSSDQEVPTNEIELLDSDSNEAEEEKIEIPSMNLNYIPSVPS